MNDLYFKKIAVVEGTTPDYSQVNTNSYPTGFTRNNCIILGLMTALGGIWYNNSELYAGLDANLIGIHNQASAGWARLPYKLVLGKYS